MTIIVGDSQYQVPGTIQKVTVTINGLSHVFPDDLHFLLVGPHGQNAIIWSDAGGGDYVRNITVTLDDDAPNPLPDNTVITSGTYRPTNYSTGYIWGDAPPASGNVALSIFNGTDPNGVWQLYMSDDSMPPLTNTAGKLSGRVGAGPFSGGWTLTITTACPSCVAQIQPPINADGSSIFNVRRGVIPVKFTLNCNGTPTCDLSPATIAVTRTAGGVIGEVNESLYTGPSDSGSNFRMTAASTITI